MLDLGNSMEHEGWSKMNSWRNNLFTKSILTLWMKKKNTKQVWKNKNAYYELASLEKAFSYVQSLETLKIVLLRNY